MFYLYLLKYLKNDCFNFSYRSLLQMLRSYGFRIYDERRTPSGRSRTRKIPLRGSETRPSDRTNSVPSPNGFPAQIDWWNAGWRTCQAFPPTSIRHGSDSSETGHWRHRRWWRFSCKYLLHLNWLKHFKLKWIVISFVQRSLQNIVRACQTQNTMRAAYWVLRAQKAIYGLQFRCSNANHNTL